MLLAHGVGAVARHLGGGARDLDPAHRRDGLGLAAIAAALVVAVGAWAGAGGPLGHVTTTVLRTLAGSAVLLLPLVLAGAGWRLLRTPRVEEPAGRRVIGWVAITAGVLGILDLVHGDPTTQAGRRSAGGILGVLAGSPLASALTGLLAVPILLLVAFFGCLVVTGTPLHAVPARFRRLIDGPPPADSEVPDDEQVTEPILVKWGRGRRKQEAAAA